MVAGRHRSHGVKREHGMLPGLLPILERIAAHPTVSAVIPGRISVTRGTIPSLRLRAGPRTVTGLKLTARRGTAAQEVFIVTTDPEALLAFLRAEVTGFDD